MTTIAVLFMAMLPPPGIIARVVTQDGGSWIIDYRIGLRPGENVVPAAVKVGVDGWVSNSRVPGHSIPHLSSLSLLNGPNVAASAFVIKAPASQLCRERLTCTVRPGDGFVDLRLKLDHDHSIYSTYDPLLGVRTVTIAVAGSTFRDVIPLDHERRPMAMKARLAEPPAERRDTRYFRSAPDSLHLAAHEPGQHFYRSPDVSVRHGTRMRLNFWYLIAAGTEGECRYRIAQYKDTPTSWRMLTDGCDEKPLKVIGHWTKVERIFTTESETTTLSLEFRVMSDTDIGEMWIDDVSLTPVGYPAVGGP